MRPVDQTPTEAADYAVISALYGSLLAGVAYSSRGHEPIAPRELLPLSAATFALSKLIVHEKVEPWLRQPFVEESTGGRRPRPAPALRRRRAARLHALYGAWSALGLVALRLHAPAAGRTATTVLAASAGNDVLQTAFKLLCERANAVREEAAQPSRPFSAARRAA